MAVYFDLVQTEDWRSGMDGRIGGSEAQK